MIPAPCSCRTSSWRSVPPLARHQTTAVIKTGRGEDLKTTPRARYSNSEMSPRPETTVGWLRGRVPGHTRSTPTTRRATHQPHEPVRFLAFSGRRFRHRWRQWRATLATRAPDARSRRRVNSSQGVGGPTREGRSTVVSRDPSPTCPESFDPQHHSPAARSIAQVCANPVVTMLHCRGSPT